MFPQATLYVQKAEYDWPGANNEPRFKPSIRSTKLEGDKDVFGDGSVTILSTPGHTPGHQSLLVKLPKTGAVVLSGDAAHFKSNWENRARSRQQCQQGPVGRLDAEDRRHRSTRRRRSSGSTTTRPSATARRCRRSFMTSFAGGPVATMVAAGMC